MVSDKDLYADKDGKLTDDPEKFATQVAVAGHELDARIAKRFGISDMLVATGEPNARRSVRGESSVHIKRIDEQEEATEEKVADTPETDEPEEEPKAAASKEAAAKEKGAKKK